MGNREDLLGGAARCLREKGYGQITARDIASAAGTSLAAIGYHFGSKEALLNAALFEVMDSWGAEFAKAIPGDDVSDPIERFATVWTELIEVATRQPELAVASFESFLVARRSPDLRAQLAAGQEEGRRGLVAMIQGIDEADVTDEQSRTLGAFYSALVTGVLSQWLVDPGRAPSGHDLAEALRTVISASD